MGNKDVVESVCQLCVADSPAHHAAVLLIALAVSSTSAVGKQSRVRSLGSLRAEYFMEIKH